MRAVMFGGLAVVACGLAADFPEWRGPERNGVVQSGPALANVWPKDGPPRVWESEPIATGGSGGLGSVIVAAGRVYLYVNEKYQVPFPERTLTEQGLQRLGWFNVKLPADLEQAVEAARISPEREALRDRALNDWIKKWVDDRLDTEGKKQYGALVTDRLRRGKAAFSFDLLARLETIKGRKFDDQAALDQWFVDNALDTPARRTVMGVIPTFVEKAWDRVYGLDQATGRTLWRAQYEGRVDAWGASGTPCFAGGRVYVAGSNGDLYCLRADSGDEVWKVPASPRPAKVQSSVLVADGAVVVLAGQLAAFDAEKGTLLWRQPKVGGQENSPVLWRQGEKTYVVVNTGKDVACVDVKDGAIRWTAPGGGWSTAAVVADRMVVLSARKEVGLSAYRLTPEKAEPLWSKPDIVDGAASPIVSGGHVYAVAKDTAACLELESGKVLWQQKIGGNGHTSPVLADGKLIAVIGKDLVLIEATPEKFNKLATAAKTGVSEWPSPALVDGRLYLRMEKGVACFDLRAEAPATPPGAN